MEPIIDPVPSAELPIMPPDVVDLVRMIDNDESCNAIFRRLCNSSLVDNVPDPSELETDKVRILFHSMPLPMVRSLLMGTIALHFYSKDAKRDNWNTYAYDDNGAGAYAATLHIQRDPGGPRGAFLSQRETRKLIELLKKYALGVKLFDDHYANDIRVFRTADRQALELTQVIDDQLRELRHYDSSRPSYFNYLERPRFAKPESSKIGVASTADTDINSLISMFEARCTIDETDAANPDLDKPQLQSPIMIGNTGYLRQRLTNHLADDYGSGSRTAKVYAITKSCLMHMGLDVKSLSIPIFVAWEDNQIDPAEVLGTVLASSKLPGHGYNVKTPGTRGTRTPTAPSRLQTGGDHVLAWKPFFRMNVEKSLDELREEAVAEDRAELMRKLNDIHDKIDEMRRLKDATQELMVDIEQARTDLDKAVATAEDELDEVQEIEEEMDTFMGNIDAFLNLMR